MWHKLLLLLKLGFPGLVKFKDIHWTTTGSNTQNLWNAYLGEFPSLCLANQGEVIRATPLESVCLAHCTYHLVLIPWSQLVPVAHQLQRWIAWQICWV